MSGEILTMMAILLQDGLQMLLLLSVHQQARLYTTIGLLDGLQVILAQTERLYQDFYRKK